MMATIALAVLTGLPAQPAGDLKLTNVRTTIGELGPARQVTKLLPGDVLFIAYDIDGITIDGEGMARYTMTMEVANSTGTRILPPPTEKVEPREMAEFVPLRGNKMPARAFVTIGLDQPAGSYTCKLSVTDTKTKATGNLNVKFEVAKKEFGVVAVYATHDADGHLSAPTSGQVGQTIYVQFSIAAFERDMKTKQPNVEILCQTLDEKGTPMLVNAENKPAPRRHVQDAKAIKPVTDTDGAFALQFPLFMNRPGKFVVEITATDRVTMKTASYKLPVTVLPAN